MDPFTVVTISGSKDEKFKTSTNANEQQHSGRRMHEHATAAQRGHLHDTSAH